MALEVRRGSRGLPFRPMAIDLDRIRSEAFFLHAETWLPDAQCVEDTLRALQLCAQGTAVAAPSVATYVFRSSRLAALVGQPRFPGSLALESSELYLTRQGFDDHLASPEFRAGLRAMYKGTRRLGVRIYWVGAQPPGPLLHNIFRSDPQARPLAALQPRLFDADVYRSSRPEDVVVLSLCCPVQSGLGATAIDAVSALCERQPAITLIPFFHPEAQDLLRVILVAPVPSVQAAGELARLLAPLASLSGASAHALGLCRVHRERQDLAQVLHAALACVDAHWDISHSGYSGYISHPQVNTEAAP